MKKFNEFELKWIFTKRGEPETVTIEEYIENSLSVGSYETGELEDMKEKSEKLEKMLNRLISTLYKKKILGRNDTEFIVGGS